MRNDGFNLFVATILGIAVGFLLHVCDLPDLPLKLGTYGIEFFCRLVRLVIFPLAFLKLLTVCLSQSTWRMGVLGLRTVAVFLATSLVGGAFTIDIALLVKDWLPKMAVKATADSNASLSEEFARQLLDLAPDSILGPILNGNIHHLIVLAFLLAVVLASSDLLTKRRITVLAVQWTSVFERAGELLVSILPIGVFFIIAVSYDTVDMTALVACSGVILAIYLCFLVQVLLVDTILVVRLTGVSPQGFLKALVPICLTSFFSSSSAITYPISYRSARKFGIEKDVADFVITLGMAINSNGLVIYHCFSAVFVAHCYGVQLTALQLFGIILSSVFTSFLFREQTPGTCASVLSMVLAFVGLPPEGVGLLLSCDFLIDRGRTLVNCVGDFTAAIIVSESERPVLCTSERHPS